MGLDEYNTESAARGEPLDKRQLNMLAALPTMSEDEAKKAIKKAEGIYKHRVHRPEFQKGSTAAKLDEASKYGAATTFTLGTAGAATLNPLVEGAAGLVALGTGGLTVAERMAKSREKVTDKNSRVMEARKCCDAKCEKNVDDQIENLRRKRDDRGNQNFGCADPEGMYLYVNKVTKGNKKDTCKKLCKADAVLTDNGLPGKDTPECRPNPDLTVSKHCGAKGKEGEVGREDTDAGTEVDADAEVDWIMESIELFSELPDYNKYNLMLFSKDFDEDGRDDFYNNTNPEEKIELFVYFLLKPDEDGNPPPINEKNYEDIFLKELEYIQHSDNDLSSTFSPPTSPLSEPGTRGGSKIYKRRKPKTRRKRKSTKKPKTNRKQKSRRKQKTNRKQKSKRKSKIKKTKRR